MVKSNVPAILLFIVALSAGIFITEASWNGLVFVSFGHGRGPAAIKRNFDFSNLQGKALSQAAHRRLVADAKLLLAEHSVGLELGHFVTRAVDGRSSFACKVSGTPGVYNRIELTFVAEGMAEHGDVPAMTVETECRAGDDLNNLAPVWIPMVRILGEKPQDMELQVWDEEPIAMRFNHIGSSWPLRWTLQSVRLYQSAKAGTELVIGPEQIKASAGRPLTFEWRGGDKSHQ